MKKQKHGGANPKGREVEVVWHVVVCGMDIVHGEGWEAEVEVGENATTVLCHGGLLPTPGFIK
jgi:hypothetical protein